MGTNTTLAAVALRKPASPPNPKFVEASEYCALAISNRPLVRLDDASNSLRGLHDPELGVTYVIHEAAKP
jgi:hypothetical protein